MTLLFAAALWFSPVLSQADAPAGALINRIELSKGGHIVLQVTDSNKRIRKFLLTCELKLTEQQSHTLKMIDVSYVPLKANDYQSLINYWLVPAIDNYITCNEKAVKERPLSKTANKK